MGGMGVINALYSWSRGRPLWARTEVRVTLGAELAVARRTAGLQGCEGLREPFAHNREPFAHNSEPFANQASLLGKAVPRGT